MSGTSHLSRRRALQVGAAATALPLVHIRSAGAAGKLSFAIWDHWVPTGNAAMQKLVDAWAEKNKVDVRLDFLTGVGGKINLTMAAEAQAKTGHDIYAFDQWTVQQYAESLDPVDDIVTPLVARYGQLGQAYQYLGVVENRWMAVPVGWGTSPLATCARISMLKSYCGIDVREWYPAHQSTPEAAKDWTYDTLLKVAEASAKNGHVVGFGCGSGSTDANQTWGAIFGAFGADLVNGKGEVTVDTPQVMAAMEYCQKLVKFIPPDAIQWDDASNNRALISGRSSLIWNPPSAWAVAKRDAPAVAEDCWTFPNPKGPMGRLVPLRPYFWGIWSFAKNKGAARDLITYLSQREQVEQLALPVAGYDIPPFTSMNDMSIWSDVEPPKGTVYNYPLRSWHDAAYYVPGSSAPPDIAVQMWNRYLLPGVVGRLLSGQTIKQSLAWATEELHGFVR